MTEKTEIDHTQNTDSDDRIQVVTFGCRLNAYESELMRGHAKDAGLTDAIVVNTCAVTSEAERQVRQNIRKLHRENPDAKIVVAGCAAQLSPEKYAEMDGVVRVLGNKDKLDKKNFKPDLQETVHVTDIMQVKESASHLLEGFEGRTRAFVQVQQGCDHRCTFCIIPFARGPNRSFTPQEIADQVRTLIANGTPEVVLTGVDITSYGFDREDLPSLGQMIKGLLRDVPELKRLRLTSLDPIGVDDDLFELLVNEPRLLPHIHLSVQAGDDMILKRMKRRHLRHHIVDLVTRLRAARPDLAIGADMIAGFPTETDEMFENGLRLVSECNITHLHVFPFSPRPGTPAAKLKQIHGTTVKERARQLRDAGLGQMNSLLEMWVGRTATVMIEAEGDTVIGRTDHYLPVKMDAEMSQTALTQAPEIGTVAAFKITSHDGTHLYGHISDE